MLIDEAGCKQMFFQSTVATQNRKCWLIKECENSSENQSLYKMRDTEYFKNKYHLLYKIFFILIS